MMNSDEIQALLDDARKHVQLHSGHVGPTVIAGALVLRVANYLEKQGNTSGHPQLAEDVKTLRNVGKNLWHWRP